MNKYLEKIATELEKKALITGFQKNKKAIGEALDTVFSSAKKNPDYTGPVITNRGMKARMLANARHMAKGDKIHLPDEFGADLKRVAPNLAGSPSEGDLKILNKYKNLKDQFEEGHERRGRVMRHRM